MKIRIGNELIPLNLLVLLLIVAIIFSPSTVLRTILGLPFLLFFPGYVLLAALFPSRGKLDGIERGALSFGVSIAVVPLIGLLLNYTWWGIRLEPVLYSVASFIFITSIIAWFRRRKLAEHERFNIAFQVRLPSWGNSIWDKALSIILAMTILGGLGVAGYAITVPKASERFTEFYILGLGGKATDYPKELKLGEEGRVIIVIINHEQEIVRYLVEVTMDGIKKEEIGVALEHGEKWEGQVRFTPDRVGDNQKVEFLLYKTGENEPYLKPPHFWVNVKE